MKKHILLVKLLMLVFCSATLAQDFKINTTSVNYDGNKLTVSYDLTTRSQSDIFYIIIDILKEDGTAVRAKSFKGDIGQNIKPGRGKSIIWVPEDDAIFLNDTVTVEVTGERYEKSFNRASVIMKSTILPGLGQSRISNGKPWWLAGIAAYGSLAGGFVFQNNYQKNYDAYIAETDPLDRSTLYDQSQKDKQVSNTLFISAATLWLGNLIWVAAAPNKYKERTLPEITVNTFPAMGSREMICMLSFTIDF